MNDRLLNERSIFLEAIEIGSTAGRSSYLDAVCEGDRRLRAQVDALLVAHERSIFLLDAVERPVPPIDWPPIEEGPGATIGAYKLLAVIGEGGMGVVFMAEQTHPVRREVALKVIRPGMDTGQVVARFEAERQALALMDHPNIARVLDGGATRGGRPYFVMELIRGVPIAEYCDREQLPVGGRLELFVLVCRAVQHAHQKGIIHRDLKPSNVLVTIVDGVAVPKVIDFGVAKATGGSLTERTLFTGFAQLLGTPLYMSPEQADLAGVDVDTRSDIYSLGVLLYELLTGTTPFDGQALREAAPDEMRRMIREDEPPKPSTRLGSLAEERRSSVSGRRGVDPRQLGRALRGELDWVVMKAMEKDRGRRYGTVDDFAADVVRHLADRPVEACPPSARYRFAKYARRNRAALATGALLTSTLLAGAAVGLMQSIRASRAADEARQRSEESRQVVDYLVKDVFGAAVRDKASGRSTTVGELMTRADSEVGGRFRDQPLVEATIRLALAEWHLSILDAGSAEPHVSRALALRERHLGPEHPETLRALGQAANVLDFFGRADPSHYESGLSVSRRLFSARRRVLGPAHPETLNAQVGVAWFLRLLGRFDEAQDQASATEKVALRVLGPNHQQTLLAQVTLAHITRDRGDLDEAEPLLRRVYRVRERALGPLHEDTIVTLKELAELALARKRFDEARRLRLELMGRFGRASGLYHVRVNSTIDGLIAQFRAERDFAAARDFVEGLLVQVLATPPDDDPYLRHRRSSRLGGLVLHLVSLSGAVPFDRELAVRAAEESVALDGDWDGIWTILAALYYRLDRLDTAEEALRESAGRPDGAGGNSIDGLIMSMIHARRGESREARSCYQKAGSRQDPRAFNRKAWQPLREEAAAALSSLDAEARPEGVTGASPSNQ